MDHTTVTPVRVRRAAQTMAGHLLAWRKLQRLPQRIVAARAGVALSTLQRVEHGDLGVSLETLLRVARALGRLDSIETCLDPLDTDLGRLRAAETLPLRVRS
ncbi:MAG: transcriptional regulator [Pseudonocardiales bacterium]|nr:MAG: transcriptional regulator [Pseudonocardiales bacterium]